LLGRAWARLQHRRPASSERGFTLIEMLIAVWIIGAILVAMVGGLFTMIRASDLSRRQALVESEVRRYAEAIRAAPYHACAASTGSAGQSYPDLTGWNGYPGYGYTPSNVSYVPNTSITSTSAVVGEWWAANDSASPIPTTFEADGPAPPATPTTPGWVYLFFVTGGKDCNPPALATDDGLQQITVTVTENGGLSATAVIYKRATS
jgi:prepilin-type N-terminal cleavage/methylation domain-containing protein